MASSPTRLTDEVGIALGNLSDAATGMFTPTLRLGVTGLSGAGKTVFITSLIHNLLTGARLPGFGPMADGRLIGAQLTEHPDRGMPRFAYEQHLGALTAAEPHWPESTRRISSIRVTLKYQSASWISGMLGPGTLNLDIVDYPGEWLLDLPLMSLNFAEWSEQALGRAKKAAMDSEARAFLESLAEVDPAAKATDVAAEALASSFTHYLRQSREDRRALSALPPGRFLMPGDMEGSPALTFAPLPRAERPPKANSLYAMLERRYEAYKSLVVRPFFRDHFARLDRQIVLVDALRALNAGPAAVSDLETALSEVLECFRAGSPNPIIQLVAKRIDRILFAATKADHLHHTSHDRLEGIMHRLVANAARRARFAGAETRSLALASIRATREDTITEDGETLPVVVGTPQAGQEINDQIYDGKTEIAFFPGELPGDPEAAFSVDADRPDIRFLKFAPPAPLALTESGDKVLPHMRLDRALDFLVGDRLR